MLVSNFIPALVVAVTASFAASVNPVHVMVTCPARSVAVATNFNVITLLENWEVTGVDDEVTPHMSFSCAVTNPAGNVTVIPLAEDCLRSLDVVNVMVAFPPGPAALLKDKDAAVIAPTAGVVTNAGMVSRDVSIFKPTVPVSVAVTSAFGARVRPVQVIVTRPAFRSLVTTKMTLSLLKDDVVFAVAGTDIAHKLAFCAVTRPEGNVSVILLSVACAVKAVDVLNEREADPSDPTALLKVRAFTAADTDPTAGVPTFAATVSTEVMMLIPPLKAADEGSTSTGDAARALKVNPEQVIVICPAA